MANSPAVQLMFFGEVACTGLSLLGTCTSGYGTEFTPFLRQSACRVGETFPARLPIMEYKYQHGFSNKTSNWHHGYPCHPARRHEKKSFKNRQIATSAGRMQGLVKVIGKSNQVQSHHGVTSCKEKNPANAGLWNELRVSGVRTLPENDDVACVLQLVLRPGLMPRQACTTWPRCALCLRPRPGDSFFRLVLERLQREF